ncbi:MAG TPA: FtsX-like permease family protein, partial [Thermoanaerobaculia bacterium]|nr:FtsX-like permease family protein [Thermoanaerobaculia bacterium]
AVGMYGVVAFSVAQRRREIGVRRALGAPGASVLDLVLRRGMALVAAGIALGLLAAMAATRLLSGLLYGVTPGDPGAYAAALLVVAAAGSLAAVLPAWRAIRVDPLEALRS